MLGANSKSGGFSKSAACFGIILPVFALALMGIVALVSASAYRTDSASLLQKQAFCLGLGIFACAFVSFINLNLLRKLTIPICIIAIVALILVLIPGIGYEVKGSRRWLVLLGQRFQPSDIGKFAIVLAMATYLHKYQLYMKKFLYGIFIPCSIIAVFCGLIALEPDFGTTFLCGSIAFTLLFMGGVRISHIAPFAIMGAIGLGILVYLNPNRFYRMTAFLNPEAHAQTGGYQLRQALFAFGAGGTNGTGLYQGRQQYSFLPEAHTDFIFANIAEELGIFGTMGVLIAFLTIFLVTIFQLRKAPNIFEFSLALGVMLMVVIQAIFNMGVVTGIFPTKGISLPFISFGGSNLVMMFIFSGILINCICRWSKKNPIEAKDYE